MNSNIPLSSSLALRIDEPSEANRTSLLLDSFPSHSAWSSSSIDDDTGQQQFPLHQRNAPGWHRESLCFDNTKRETFRMGTYLNFPTESPMKNLDCELAECGFYYTGYKDRVKCFSCDQTVQNWCANDNPKFASWHSATCKLVFGTDSGNKPLGNRKPKFVYQQSHALSSLQSNESLSSSISARVNPSQSAATASPSGFDRDKDFSPHSRSSGLSNLTSRINDIDICKPDPTAERRTTEMFLQRGTRNAEAIPLPPDTTLNRSMESSIIENRQETQHLDLHVTPSSRSATSCSPIVGQPTNSRSVVQARTEILQKEDNKLQRQFPCRDPVNPHMKDYQARWESFGRLPSNYKVYSTKEEIARAGFFFEDNNAKCFYCGATLEKWNLIEKPFAEHAKRSPQCEYLLHNKGVDFVKSIISKALNLHQLSSQSRPIAYKSDLQHPIQVYRDPRRGARSLRSSPPSSRSHCSTDIPKPSNMARFPTGRKACDPRASTSAMGIEGEDVNPIGSLFNQNSPLPSSCHLEARTQGSAVGETEEILVKESPFRKRRSEVSPGSFGASAAKISRRDQSDRINMQIAELRNERKCISCLDRPADTVVMPCKHMSLCGVCAATATKCGSCNVAITDKLDVLFS